MQKTIGKLFTYLVLASALNGGEAKGMNTENIPYQASRDIHNNYKANSFYLASAKDQKNLNKAQELFLLGSFSESVIYFTRVISTATNQSLRNKALTGRAQAYIILNQPLLSIRDLQKTSYPKNEKKANARKDLILGVAYIQANQYELAINSLNLASKVLTGEATLFSNRAVAYQNLNKIKLAKVDLYKALELNPTPSTILNLAVIERKSGNYKTCLSILDRLKGSTQNYSRIFLERGSCLKKLGNTELALKNFLKAIELEGPTSFALQEIGEILISKGDKKNGIIYLEKASEILLQSGKIEQYGQLIETIEKIKD